MAINEIINNSENKSYNLQNKIFRYSRNALITLLAPLIFYSCATKQDSPKINYNSGLDKRFSTEMAKTGRDIKGNKIEKIGLGYAQPEGYSEPINQKYKEFPAGKTFGNLEINKKLYPYMMFNDNNSLTLLVKKNDGWYGLKDTFTKGFNNKGDGVFVKQGKKINKNLNPSYNSRERTDAKKLLSFFKRNYFK
jgi:hypothetical protein